MAGLEGTVHTPLGTVQKKTALYLGTGVVVLAAIVYYRQKHNPSSNAAASSDTTEIDPATGYAYGSPEDAAALASQSNYVTPSGGSGGGGSPSVPASNAGYTSNGEWTQGVIQYMLSNNLVSDPTALSAALGKFITGAYVTESEHTLIQQAIAVQGFPPISGSNGYPPSINTQPAPSNVKPGPVSGIHATRIGANEVTLVWTASAHSRGYDITWSDSHGRKTSSTSLAAAYTMPNLLHKERYTVQIRGRAETGSTPGDWSPSFTVTTKAK